MDSLSVSPNSGAVDLSSARTGQPVPPPPPPQHDRGRPLPRMREQDPGSELSAERSVNHWLLDRLSSGELAVDSPGKSADIAQIPGRRSEDVTADTDAPTREKLEQHFKSTRQKPASRFPMSADQLLTSGSMDDNSSHRLSESSEEENRRQATLIVSAVEALASADTKMASLSAEHKAMALIYAAARGYLTVVKKLVREGVDLTAEDARGCTALTAAATRNQAAVVEYLMRQMPEVRMRPSAGKRSDQQDVAADAETARVEAMLRSALVYNIGNSLREANRPESRWYGQSQTRLPEGPSDAD